MKGMHIVRKEELPLIGSSYNFVGAEQGDLDISLFLVEAQPGRGAPLHLHEYDEIILVQDGVSRFVVGEEIHEGGPGDIIVVKARRRHGFVNGGLGVLRQIEIHVSFRFRQELLAPTETSRRGPPAPFMTRITAIDWRSVCYLPAMRRHRATGRVVPSGRTNRDRALE